MHPQFQPLTPRWFYRAHVYTGSIGDFRYRFAQVGKEAICASVYSKVCYEVADDVESREFPWTEEGVKALQEWVQGRYEAFTAENG